MTEMSIDEHNVTEDLNQNLTGGNMVKLFKGLVLAAVVFRSQFSEVLLKLLILSEYQCLTGQAK